MSSREASATKQSPLALNKRFLPGRWGLLRFARNDRTYHLHPDEVLAPGPARGSQDQRGAQEGPYPGKAAADPEDPGQVGYKGA